MLCRQPDGAQRVLACAPLHLPTACPPCNILLTAHNRTAADIASANDVDLSKLRDPEPDSARVKNPDVSLPMPMSRVCCGKL